MVDDGCAYNAINNAELKYHCIRLAGPEIFLDLLPTKLFLFSYWHLGSGEHVIPRRRITVSTVLYALTDWKNGITVYHVVIYD